MLYRELILLTLALAVLAAGFLGAPQLIFGQAVEERRAALQKELAALEAQIEVQRRILEERQRESVSLERDIAILTAHINKARLSIKARNLAIERLSRDIGERHELIGALSQKMERERESLAQLLRRTYKTDSFSLVEVVLSNQNLSEFFADVDAYTAIKAALRDSFRALEATKTETEAERVSLEEKRGEEVELRRLQELETKKLEARESDKQRILKISRGIEAEYQKVLVSQERSAAQIRAELFTLRGTAAIPFEKAYEFAREAGERTGVRPALILGVIAEESNLGENVGTGNWREDMKHPRDTEPFVDITRRLGLDPDRMPVSRKPWYGWGGAMGPAQFIPSTWVLYEKRIASATGNNPPNPWDPYDAFFAAAILLMDNGADKGGFASERLAALRYFAGWNNATKPAYAFYGDDVMELAAKYQRQIDILVRS